MKRCREISCHPANISAIDLGDQMIGCREKISRRSKAGLERVRAMGKALGRPKLGDGDRERLRAALDGGNSWHAVSIATRIPYSTVKKHARALGYEPPGRVPSTAAKNPAW